MHIPPDIAEQHARMVEVSLLAGERDRAIRAIERAFELAAARNADTVTESTYLADHLSHRLVNFLEALRIYTVGDLIQVSPVFLLNFRQCGIERLGQIEGFLHANGFRLAPSKNDIGGRRDSVQQ